MKSFWDTLPTLFFCLAPMEDVTDVAFRALIASYKPADVMWTEFTSADGLVKAPSGVGTRIIEGKDKLLKKLEYSENERPIVAQLFSATPAHIEQAAALCAARGFDGIDINMGCPDKKVEKQGCGSAMIKTPEKAVEIIRAAKRGAPELPLSVKTRAGYKSDDELEEWLTVLLREDIAALTLHARTRNDLSKVPARWNLVARAVQLRDTLLAEGRLTQKTKIIGNGDVESVAHGRTLATQTGCDGVMLGRAIFGNPALFAEKALDAPERLRALEQLIELWEEKMKGYSSYAVLKKHYAAFVKDFDGAKELRMQLMETQSAREALALLQGAL